MPSNTFATSGRDLVGHRIDNGRLEFLSTLGVGAYGVVYLAVDLHAPRPVYLAVKCLLRAGLDSRQRHFQRREIALHQLASRHPNVVTLHKVLEEGEFIFVIMDFCDEGDLFGMITEKQRYLGNDYLIKKIFLQIIDAVDYCHRMGIFHRDLKPENILCTQNGERICIADFGLATSERHSTDFGCGSTFYLSPECQGGLFERLESYSTETNDIWSLGVILVNLTCGRNPWRQACPNDETFRAYVHNPDFLRTILPISKATNRILKGLFALEPRDRTPLKVLREQILRVETFSMTDDELKTAHSAARAAAAAVRQVAPTPAPAPPVHVAPPAAPVKTSPRVAVPVTIDEDAELDEFAHQHAQRKHCANAPRYNNRGEPEEAATLSSWSSGSSTYATLSQAQIDKHVFAQIDFSKVNVVGVNATANSSLESTETPALIAGEVQDPLDIYRTSPRSSSSGDISLPPTPEFSPVDNTSTRPRPINTKGNQQLTRPDLLHVNMNPQSPLSGEFIL
ncbi:RAN protein kinase [Kwoniella mangroviensis CBS 8886]|nr:RAN protein kinase [Kwoniella mangroviensis CBS 8886]